MFSEPPIVCSDPEKLVKINPSPTLWCIYPLGHDESLACPDLWSAHHYTDVANRLWGHLKWPDGGSLYFRAKEWTGTPEQHAESLKEWPDAKAFMDDRKAFGEKIRQPAKDFPVWNRDCPIRYGS